MSTRPVPAAEIRTDVVLHGPPERAAGAAAAAEARGIDGLLAAETRHDPFLALAPLPRAPAGSSSPRASPSPSPVPR
ncbi:hypothetical protein ACFQ2M_06620 [Kitasatospora saccharophila]|uniref:hypothetical protein n=1 Tax=Kitasatospora saccharophila TaxID=407973 RepID=UPI00362A8E6E